MDNQFFNLGKNLRVDPPQNTWDRIQKRMESGNATTRNLRFMGMAASILILLAFAAYLFSYSQAARGLDKAKPGLLSDVDLNAYSKNYEKAYRAWIVKYHEPRKAARDQ